MPGLVPGVPAVKKPIAAGFKTMRPGASMTPRPAPAMPRPSAPRTTVPPAAPKAGRLTPTGGRAPGVPAKGAPSLPKPVATAPKIAVPGIKRASWEGLAKARRRRQPSATPAAPPAALRRRQLKPAVTMDDLMGVEKRFNVESKLIRVKEAVGSPGKYLHVPNPRLPDYGIQRKARAVRRQAQEIVTRKPR